MLQDGSRRSAALCCHDEEYWQDRLADDPLVAGPGVVLTAVRINDFFERSPAYQRTTTLVRLTDKREFRAKVIGADKRTDVALLKIDAADKASIWTHRFEDTLEDVFELQDKVALANSAIIAASNSSLSASTSMASESVCSAESGRMLSISGMMRSTSSSRLLKSLGPYRSERKKCAALPKRSLVKRSG